MQAIFLFFAIVIVNGQRPLFPEFPDPRIVIVGPTGAGKSSLANALLGCDPRTKDCLFDVCDQTDSCTKDTTAGVGQWLGEGQNFTVVDTPGFGDSDDEDDVLVESMMDFLANDMDHSNTMLLLLDGRITRFSKGLQSMIKRMTLMFGTGWWDFVIVGVSFWPYDQDSIEERQCYPDYPDLPCHDESWFQQEMNGQMQEKFGIEKNLTFVYTDSWSQTAGPPHFNTDDPLQQEHWREETEILWDITTSRNSTFSFMTINDFMEENARQKAEIKWLNDVITNNITELQESMKKQESKIQTNIEDIGNQEGRIQSNIMNIVNLEIQGDSHEFKIETNIESIGNQGTEISAITNDLISPVGSIIGWIPTGPGQATGPLEIPDGWQRCNGNLIDDNRSPFYGLKTPNINGDGLFLRGGADDRSTTVQDAQILSHSHDASDSGHSHSATVGDHKHEIYSAEKKINDEESIDPMISDPGTCFEKQGYDCEWSDSYMKGATPTVTIATGKASISVSSSGGEENRPKNIAVVYIIRIF